MVPINHNNIKNNVDIITWQVASAHQTCSHICKIPALTTFSSMCWKGTGTVSITQLESTPTRHTTSSPVRPFWKTSINFQNKAENSFEYYCHAYTLFLDYSNLKNYQILDNKQHYAKVMQTAIKTVASMWRESKLAYLALNIICSEMRRVSESEARFKLWASRNRYAQEQRSHHNFVRNRSYCDYYSPNILQFVAINVLEQLTVHCIGCSILIVLWYDYIKKKNTSPFFYNNHKPLPHLELAFKRSLNVSFLNWGISLEVHPRMFSSFSWGIFDYIMRLDLSHAGKSICWFITSNKALCLFPKYCR